MFEIRGIVRLFLGGLLTTLSVVSAAAQAPDPYYDFLIAHRLESLGDAKGAQAALERALAAEPGSAELRAEMAAFFMRQNRQEEAEKAAREALALNGNAIEAHRVLGLLLSASPRTTGEAITHLERVMSTPTGATDVSVQFTLGRLYMLAGAAEKAVDILQRVVAEQPFLVQARTTLAQAQSAAGRHEDAIETLRPAAAADPRLNGTIAQYYERAGQIGEAANHYRRALEANPNSRDLQMRLAATLLALPGRENARRAAELLSSMAERNPNDTSALYLQSQAQLRLGDGPAAEKAARALLAIDRESLPGAYALAQALGYAHRHQDVINHLEPFLASSSKQGSERVRMLAYLGFAYQSLGQHDNAIDTLQRARESAPGDSMMDVYIVQAHLTAKRYADAAKLASEARVRFPQEPQFLHLQARALLHTSTASRALTDLEELVKGNPEDLESQLVLAELYADTGRVDQAIALLDRSAKERPGDIGIEFRRGAILEQADRYAAAEQAFRNVLARDARHANALNYLGYMLAERGERIDEAIGLISKALEFDAGNPSFLDSLGWAYFKKGDLVAAERNLSRAAGALPYNSVVQSHLGDLLARLGRHREAADAWTRALNGDGQDITPTDIERKIRDARAKGR